MKKSLRQIVIALLSVLLVQCKYVMDPLHCFVTVENNSSDTLAFFFIDANNGEWFKGGCPIFSNEKHSLASWDSAEEIMYKHPEVNVFVFYYRDTKGYNTDYQLLRSTHSPIKEYFLTKEYMESHNWTITYP